MKYLKAVISTSIPRGNNLWIKPVEDGFALYVVTMGGGCRPLKVVEDNATRGASDDRVIAVEEQKPGKFTVVVTTTKSGNDAKAAAAALADEVASKLGPEIYNIWAEGPLEFNFTEPDTNGRNCTIKGDGLELKITVGVNDSGTNPVVEMTSPSYSKSHGIYKNAYLTTYFSSLIAELTVNTVEGVLDEGEVI